MQLQAYMSTYVPAARTGAGARTLLPPTRTTERAGALGVKADAVAARERMARESLMVRVVC